MAFVGRDRGIHVWAMNGNVALGGEAVGDVLFRVALQLHAHADDAFFVAEEPVCLVMDELL